MATTLSSPSTPSSRKAAMAYARTPSKSSPLTSMANSSPVHSPTSAAQDRRRSQYKSLGFNPPILDRARASSSKKHSTGRGKPIPPFELTPAFAEAPRTTVLRDRFRERCLERAAKDREQRIKGKRRASELSSDGRDETMDWDDEEEDDEAVLNDELFQRIMASVNRKQQHVYRLSYAHDVGSSFDPDMEDITDWERELREEASDLPDDYDDDEIAAYAAERELLDGLTAEDIFTYSDIDDIPPLGEEHNYARNQPGLRNTDEDVEMEM